MKNLTVGHKIYLCIGLVVAGLLLVSGWSITGINKTISQAESSIDGTSLTGTLSNLDGVHLKWVQSLSDYFVMDDVNSFHKEIDPHKCALGKWIGEGGRDRAIEAIPEVEDLLMSLDAPHRQLHESATSILAAATKVDYTIGSILLEAKTGHQNWSQQVFDALEDEDSAVLGDITDTNTSEIGLWLIAPKTRELMERSPEFASLHNQLLDRHTDVYQSCQQMQSSLAVGDIDTANEILFESMMDKNTQVFAAIDEIIGWYDIQMEGMTNARHIYAEISVPHMHQLDTTFIDAIKVVEDNIPDSQLMLSSAKTTRAAVLIIAITASLLGIGLSTFLTRKSIVAPMMKTVAAIETVADGDLTGVLDIQSKDEIGRIAEAFNRMRTQLHTIIMRIDTDSQTLGASTETINDQATSLKEDAQVMSEISTSVSSACTQLDGNISTMATSADEMSGTLNSVSISIEEMSASISEVAKNSVRGSEIATKADLQAKQSVEIMGQLQESSIQINRVMEVISNIAGQTNLLALNATIEAASAGDAGKGFAVVANEVKELARQTASATDEIRSQIEGMQSNTENAVQSIESISLVISEVSDISQSIASAVEEQSATIHEISQSGSNANVAAQGIAQQANESAEGTRNISTSIVNVKNAAQETEQSVSRTSESSHDLHNLSDDMRSIVSQFKL
ncbi:MAG: HAMP domain-containing protein [bacterium]|nr:HAMP domain-containing protein [bacterium]